jgi:GTPase involved in cell partitioning and DNA repair
MCLVYVLDMAAGELACQHDELREQVCAYRPDMADRPNMIVLNKRDLCADDIVKQVCVCSRAHVNSLLLPRT